MKKLIIFIPFLLFALDSDLDGVPDNMDLCPNTPFLETVNKYGCSKSQLEKFKIKYNLTFGYEYDKYENYKNSELLFYSFSGKKNNFKLSLYYSLLNDGYQKAYKSNDLITALAYYKNFKNISLKFALKYYFHTFYNKKSDYAFFIQGIHFFNNIDIGLSEKYKIYNEKNTNPTHTITTFIDFYKNKIIISPYLYFQNSYWNSSKWYKYLGITLSYTLNTKFTFSIDYSTDLTNSKNNTIDGNINYSF